jgi:regulator of sigma E protease
VSWLLVFAGFCALIILHEFGHFLAAKATGMRVERFFLFFPPKLVSIKRGETEYGIGAIPLGGFVKITGMNPEELEPREAADGAAVGRPELATAQTAGRDTPEGLLERIEASGQDPSEREGLSPEVLKRAYYNQPVWKRIVVIGAGPAMNVLICFVILFVLAFSAQEVKGPGLEVGSLQSGSPASAQLHPGDKILSIDGIAADNLNAQDRAQKFHDQIGTHTCAGTPTDGCKATTPVQVVVLRDGQRIPLSITPEYDPTAKQPLLGVRFQASTLVPVNPSPPEAAGTAVSFMWRVTSATVSTIARIFEPEQRKQLSGVVGISDVAHQTIEFGATEALTLLAIISLSLAIINLFPFLPLDGGHIFWSLVEKVRGRRVPFSVIERASAVGMLLILFLFVIGLTNDIGRLTGQGFNVR